MGWWGGGATLSDKTHAGAAAGARLEGQALLLQMLARPLRLGVEGGWRVGGVRRVSGDHYEAFKPPLQSVNLRVTRWRLVKLPAEGEGGG